MNQKEKILAEKNNWHSFSIPSREGQRVKKNAVFIHKNAEDMHERTKFEVCLALKSLGHKFITEAEEIINSVRYRRDVVDITSGMRFEIETNPKRAERFKKDPETNNIVVIDVCDLIEDFDYWDDIANKIHEIVKKEVG